jgi:hypothetical protein
MVVALVTSPVLAVKVPSGTKLNATWTGFGTAIAGEAPAPKAAPTTPTSKAFRKLSGFISLSILLVLIRAIARSA